MRHFLFILLCLLCWLSNPHLQAQNTGTIMQDPFQEDWEIIDSLHKVQQFQSALEKSQEVYTKAIDQNALPAKIRAHYYMVNFSSLLQEDESVAAIQQLENILVDSSLVTIEESLIKTILAKKYWEYLQSNYWQMRDRTEQVEDDLNDINSWSIGHFIDRIAKLYWSALDPVETLQNTRIEQYATLFTKAENTDQLRPTLYDAIGHEALNYFKNDQSYITQPKEPFVLNEKSAFWDASEFTNIQYEHPDSNSNFLQAVLLFQQLITNHLDNDDPAALVHIDLLRLRFFFEKATLDQKDRHYLAALKRLADKYTAPDEQAEIQFNIAALYQQQGNNYNPSYLDEVFPPKDQEKWGYQKAVDLCREVIKAYPETYGAMQCNNILSQLTTPQVQLQLEQVNLPDLPFLGSISYRNLSQVSFSLYQLSTEAYLDFQQIRKHEDKISAIQSKKALKSWTVDLPKVDDYHQHRVEIDMDPLSTGSYVLLMSSGNKVNKAAQQIGIVQTQVSKIGFFKRFNDDRQTEYILMDRQSGSPLEGVTATLYDVSYDRNNEVRRKFVTSLKSDQNGRIQPKREERGQLETIFHLGADTLQLRDNAGFYPDYDDFDPLEIQRSTYFFTDRSIYRPGQTIFFKGLAIKKRADENPQVAVNETVTVVLYNTNYQPVDELKLVTNEYGTISGQFTAPTAGINGRMTLISDFGNSRKSISVEEYKRPQFEVTIAPFEGNYGLGDTIEVTGEAMGYAGNAVSNATLNYRVVRKVSFPWMPFYYRRFYPTPSIEDAVIAYGTGRTSEDGQFSFSFPATVSDVTTDQLRPLYRFEIEVDVSDITGETHEAKRIIKLAAVSEVLDIDAQEQINMAQPDSIAITTKNLDNQPIELETRVKIERLQSPDQILVERYWEQPDQFIHDQNTFKKLFPHYGYRLEGESAFWKTTETVFDRTETIDGQWSWVPDWADWGIGTYRMTVSTGSDSTLVKTDQIITVYDLENGNLPDHLAYLVSPNHLTLEPGESLSINLLGNPNAPIQVYAELARASTILNEQWMNFSNQTKQSEDYTITEADRGGIYHQMTFIQFNRPFEKTTRISVPYTNKQLSLAFKTFRDKLQPGSEERWEVVVKGPKGDAVAAEMVATMYDASLDAFVVNDWQLNLFSANQTGNLSWQNRFFSSNYLQLYLPPSIDQSISGFNRTFRSFIWSHRFPRYDRIRLMSAEVYEEDVSFRDMAADVPPMEATRQASMGRLKTEAPPQTSVPPPPPPPPAAASPSQPVIRENLSETVFFMPELRTDTEGNISFSFKMNEALTRWKFLGFAHTQDLAYGHLTDEVVTQKELMIQPNAPRFFRQKDEIVFTAKVSNLTDRNLTGKASLILLNPKDEQDITASFQVKNTVQSIEVDAKGNTVVKWALSIPDDLNVVAYRVIVEAGQYSDGEQKAIPILSNRMLVTESIPVTIRGKQKKTFDFNSLQQTGQSSTLKHHSFSLSMSTNPAWYAVQALPYLMEYPYDCTEQVFNRFYANYLGREVIEQHPRIKSVFQNWRNNQQLSSPLEDNEKLRGILLEETPWVLEAEDEVQQMNKMANLFDEEQLMASQEAALDKLQSRQLADGGFPWFPGGRHNWYITQYIVEGLGKLGIEQENPLFEKSNTILVPALQFIDDEMLLAYNRLKEAIEAGKAKASDNHLNHLALHYLYTRTFFLKDHPLSASIQEVVDFYENQLVQHWMHQGLMGQALAGMVAHRLGNSELVGIISKSLKERALKKEELGTHWKYNAGFYWYQLPIETHVTLLAFFAEAGDDPELIEEMKIWLLKNKQTNRWETTKSTAAAVHALLNHGENWLEPTKPFLIDFPELVETSYEAVVKKAQESATAGTGHFEASWTGDEVKPQLGKVRIKNKNKVMAWGGLYWQYFEDLDQIKTFEETPLVIKKQLYQVVFNDEGQVLKAIDEGTTLSPGMQLMVRIELQVDRDMEFVHMKDMRASGLEPMNVFSRYKWQGGLGYYETTKDAATNFFFDWLPRGSYVFEYPLRVVHEGDFSNGITTVQCMYAPSFSSHSEGIRVKVE